MSQPIYTFEQMRAVETERNRAVSELELCRAALDAAQNHSTSISGGINCLVSEIRWLRRRLERLPQRIQDEYPADMIMVGSERLSQIDPNLSATLTWNHEQFKILMEHEI